MPAQQSALATMLGLHGDNPEKLDLIDIDPTKIQKDTVAGNLLNSSEIFNLANLANDFSSDQLLKMLEKMMPGYSSLRDKATSNISSFLSGEIPKDVERLLEQRAAEKGVTLGTSGSDFQKFDTLRQLGLTSLDITQRGLDSASRWLASAPRAPQFDFTSMFFTPQQRLSFELAQEQANLPIRSFNNWVETLPSNLERGAGQLLDWVAQTGSSVIEMGTGAGIGNMLGGMGGGNAGGGGEDNGAGVNTGFGGGWWQGGGGYGNAYGSSGGAMGIGRG